MTQSQVPDHKPSASMPPAAAPATPRSASPDATKPGRGLGTREWSMILAAVAGAGVVTMSMLTSNGAMASPEAAAAIAGAANAPAPASTTAETVVPKWSDDNRLLWVGTNKKGLAFEMPALNRVQVWMKTVRPALVVRCSSNTAEVFVFTETAARIEPNTEAHTVTFSIDDQPGVTQQWEDSVDHDGLFAPDGPTFAQRLMHARTLRFEFSPHNAAPVVVNFSVSGLRDVLDPAAKECGWQK